MPDDAPPRREWLTVLVFCLFAWTVSNLDQSLFGYAVPGITTEFGVGLETIGIILSIGFIVAAVIVVFAGLAADSWGRRWTLGLLLAAVLLVGVILWWGWDYSVRGRVQTVIGLESFSMFWAYLAMPVGAVFSLIALVGHLLDPQRNELESAQ